MKPLNHKKKTRDRVVAQCCGKQSKIVAGCHN